MKAEQAETVAVGVFTSEIVYRPLGIVDQQRAIGWEPVLVTSGKHGVFALTETRG